MKRLPLLVLPISLLMLLGAGCWTTTVNVKVNRNATVEDTNGAVTVNTSAATNQPAEVSVKLVINKGNASPVRTFDEKVAAGTTTLALLEKVAAANSITLNTKQYDFGVIVNGIDGLDSTDKQFWLFSVNGKESPVGAGEYTVQNGDTIEFRYTSGTE